jgi:hypothetical protein
VDLRKLAVHLVHFIDGGWRQGFRGSVRSGLDVALLTAGGGSHPFDLRWGGYIVCHQDHLHPEAGLMPRWPLAHQLAHSTVVPPLIRRRVAEHGLVLVSPPDGCTVAQKGGRCLATVAPAAMESSP